MKKLLTILIAISIGIILMFSEKSVLKASTTYSWTTKESRIYIDQNGTETTTSWQTIPYTQSVSYPVTQMQYRLKYSRGLTAGNVYKFKISFLPNPDALNSSGIWFSDGTNTLTDVNCSGWSRESNNYYANICAISPITDISSSNYLYVRVVFNESYVNSVRSYVGDFEETKGTGAIIQDSAIDIMNNQNDNTQAIIDSNKVCTDINKSIWQENKAVRYSDGEIVYADNIKISNYISINQNSELTLIEKNTSAFYSICFYNSNKQYISCKKQDELNIGKVNIPNNARYLIASINMTTNTPKWKVCKNGNQALQDTLEQDHTYNNNASENIAGQNELDEHDQLENGILNNLDFSALDDMQLSIDSNSSSFIWYVVNRLRGISEKIVLLFSSVLSLGIIKMILSR